VSPGRREFLKTAGLNAGLLLTGPRLLAGRSHRAPAIGRNAPEITVIGAGAFGGWTAYWLQRMGAQVTLVDEYGPGNSRATSGDETRGVRSSYGDRPYPDLWVTWAHEASRRWKAFDEEWSRDMKVRLFFTTGDLIFRAEETAFTRRALEYWRKHGIRHETPSVADVQREYPAFDLRELTVALYEPEAGVVRARRACEVVAEAFQQLGGEVRIGRAVMGAQQGRELRAVELTGPSASLRSGIFVFALGPWFPTAFPGLMGERIRTPMGHVHYFGTPPGNASFTYPNLPSWNFPGVTGWPALPVDNRGFRVRNSGDRLFTPDLSPRAFDRRHDRRPRQLLRDRFPLLARAPLLETRACHYEASTSGNFIIDKHPDYDNVWIAGGGSAEGFKFGPVVGEYVAKRVLGDPGDPEIAESFSLEMSDPMDPPPGTAR